MNVEKRAIRQRLRQQRRGLPTGTVEAAGRAVHERLRGLAPYAAAASVIAYIAHENEVPTEGLLAEAASRGRPIYLPRSGVPVGVARWRLGDPLQVGPGGAREPADGLPTPPELPGVAIIPLIGWDVHGSRLGRGGGFYDRLFVTLDARITRVGLAYEFQECPELPRDPWDVPLDYVITERRVVPCCDAAAVGSLQKGELRLS